MNFKTTIVLIVLLVCVGIYFAVTRLGGHAGETSTSTAGKVIDVDAADVTKVAITQSDGKQIVLDKSGAQWRLTQPVNAVADSFAVEDLVRQLAGLQSRGQLPPDQKASVGLNHPNFVVDLTSKDGKVTRLSVGQKSEISDAMYVLVDDKNKPEIVSSALYDQLDKPAGTYRSKKLVDATTDQIKQLRITHEGRTIRLIKEGNDWQIVEPKKMPADSTAVSDLLFTLSDLNATDFVEKPSKPATYGLNNPVMTVWFSTEAPTTEPAKTPASQPAGTTIALGHYESVLQKNVYASVNDGPIVTVAASTVDSLGKTPLDLRDKKIVDIDPAHVERFTLAVNRAATTRPTTRPSQQYEYTIARRNQTQTFGPTTRPAPTTPPTTEASSKWIVESGGSGNGNANDAEVEALLGALHPLRATKFLEKAPATEPSATYTLSVHAGPANGQGPQDFTLHFTDSGPANAAIGSYDDLVFEADHSILDKLAAKFSQPK